IDENERARLANLKTALFDGYRAADLRGMSELPMDTLACFGKPAGTRAFRWKVSTAAIFETKDDGPLLKLQHALADLFLKHDVLILQGPADASGHSTLSFHTASSDVVDWCKADRTPALACTGVSEAEGPTKPQCGL